MIPNWIVARVSANFGPQVSTSISSIEMLESSWLVFCWFAPIDISSNWERKTPQIEVTSPSLTCFSSCLLLATLVSSTPSSKSGISSRLQADWKLPVESLGGLFYPLPLVPLPFLFIYFFFLDLDQRIRLGLKAFQCSYAGFGSSWVTCIRNCCQLISNMSTLIALSSPVSITMHYAQLKQTETCLKRPFAAYRLLLRVGGKILALFYIVDEFTAYLLSVINLTWRKRPSIGVTCNCLNLLTIASAFIKIGNGGYS